MVRPPDALSRFATRQARIGVLLGGISSEREVSLRSGEAVAKALEAAGHPVERIDVRDDRGDFLAEQSIDVAFIALHGRFGEDGGVQRLLERRGIPYTGSDAGASARAMDKADSKRLFAAREVPTAPFAVIPLSEGLTAARAAAERIGWPVVVKPSCEGSSVGVSIHATEMTLPQGLREAYAHGPTAIVEQYVKGREMTVGILDGAALPIVEMRPKRKFFDYDAKYRDADTEYIVDPPMPDRLRERIQAAAIEAHRALGCGSYSRVDIILSRWRRPCVLEVNTIPGMTERSLFPKAARAAGIEFPALCERLVLRALELAAKRPVARGNVA